MSLSIFTRGYSSEAQVALDRVRLQGAGGGMPHDVQNLNGRVVSGGTTSIAGAFFDPRAAWVPDTMCGSVLFHQGIVYRYTGVGLVTRERP